MGLAGPVAALEFAPSFAMADGRVVNIGDSVKLEPGLATTMLQGLVLPNDMEKVPEDLQPSLVHASAYLVQVCPNIARFDFLALSVTLNFCRAYNLLSCRLGRLCCGCLTKPNLSSLRGPVIVTTS